MSHDTILIAPATFAPDERFDQALAHHRQHNLAAAGKIYREILRENPGHVGAMQNLIDVLCSHEGRHLEAVPLAERLVSLFPESADALHQLGWLYGGSMGSPIFSRKKLKKIEKHLIS